MKNEAIRIRMSTKQKQSIQNGAKQANETVTTYILRKVLQNDLFLELQAQSKNEKQTSVPKKEFLQKLKNGLISNNEIATILNIKGYSTIQGKPFTRYTVGYLLNSFGIETETETENENETLKQLAQ